MMIYTLRRACKSRERGREGGREREREEWASAPRRTSPERGSKSSPELHRGNTNYPQPTTGTTSSPQGALLSFLLLQLPSIIDGGFSMRGTTASTGQLYARRRPDCP